MAPPPDFTMARTRSRFPPPRAATRSPATSLVVRAESRDRELTPQSHLQLHPAGSLARTDSWWAFSHQLFRARDVVHPLHLVYCLPLGEHGNFGEGAPQAGSSTHQDLEDSFPLQPTPYRLQEGVQRVIKLVVNKHIVWAMSSLLECGSD